MKRHLPIVFLLLSSPAWAQGQTSPWSCPDGTPGICVMGSGCVPYCNMPSPLAVRRGHGAFDSPPQLPGNASLPNPSPIIPSPPNCYVNGTPAPFAECHPVAGNGSISTEIGSAAAMPKGAGVINVAPIGPIYDGSKQVGSQTGATPSDAATQEELIRIQIGHIWIVALGHACPSDSNPVAWFNREDARFTLCETTHKDKQ